VAVATAARAGGRVDAARRREGAARISILTPLAIALAPLAAAFVMVVTPGADCSPVAVALLLVTMRP
jgi:hypothetical protein